MDKRKGKGEKRIVVHVDMDHFFTATEEREHPEYKGQPVVVGADPKDGKGRGVVSTCNYEARRFGSGLRCPFLRLGSVVAPQSFFQSITNSMERSPQKLCLSSEDMRISLNNLVLTKPI